MASLRDQIIDALIAALKANGAPANVIEERTRALEGSALPAIVLYFDDEEPQPLAQQKFKAPIVEKALGVSLEYRAAPGDGVAPRKAIDPLYLWSMQQIFADESFGGLAMGVVEGATRSLSKEGDQVVAAAQQRFTIYYRTSRLDPTSKG